MVLEEDIHKETQLESQEQEHQNNGEEHIEGQRDHKNHPSKHHVKFSSDLNSPLPHAPLITSTDQHYYPSLLNDGTNINEVLEKFCQDEEAMKKWGIITPSLDSELEALEHLFHAHHYSECYERSKELFLSRFKGPDSATLKALYEQIGNASRRNPNFYSEAAQSLVAFCCKSYTFMLLSEESEYEPEFLEKLGPSLHTVIDQLQLLNEDEDSLLLDVAVYSILWVCCNIAAKRSGHFHALVHFALNFYAEFSPILRGHPENFKLLTINWRLTCLLHLKDDPQLVHEWIQSNVLNNDFKEELIKLTEKETQVLLQIQAANSEKKKSIPPRKEAKVQAKEEETKVENEEKEQPKDLTNELPTQIMKRVKETSKLAQKHIVANLKVARKYIFKLIRLAARNERETAVAIILLILILSRPQYFKRFLLFIIRLVNFISAF